MATRYTSQFRNIDSELWTINIVDEDYSGSSPFEFTVGGYGFELTYHANVNDPFEAIIPSSVRFEFLIQNSNDEWLLSQIPTSEEGRFTVTIYDDADELFWTGTILCDQVTTQDEAYPQRCEITASDDLGVLKSIPFTTNSGVGYGGREQIAWHLWQALSKTRHWGNLDWNADMIRWANNFAAASVISSSIDQLSNVAVHNAVWWNFEDGEVTSFASCYEVIENLAIAFNARCFQHKGKMYFIPVGCYADFTTSSSSLQLYGRDGYGNNSSSATATDVGLHAGTDVFRLRGNTLSFLPPFRRAEKTWQARGDVRLLKIRQYLNEVGSFDWQQTFQAVTDGGLVYPEDTEIQLQYQIWYNWENDTSQANNGVPFLRFVIQCGSLYCTNSVGPSGATFSISAASWGASSGYYYAPMGQFWYSTPDLGNPPANNVTWVANLTLPALPSEQEALTITPAVVGFEEDISTSVTNFSSADAYAFLSLDVYKEQEAIGNASEILYAAQHAYTNGAQTYSQTTRIGSSGYEGTDGQLVTDTGGAEDALPNWKSIIDSNFVTGNILALGCQEIVALIRKALEVRQGDLKGEFVSPLNWIEINGDGFLVIESTFEAQTKRSTFSAFKIQKDLSDIVVPTGVADFGTQFDDTVAPSNNDAVDFIMDTVTDHEDVVKHLTVTQAVNLDTLETQTNTNTTSISGINGILAVLKRTFQPKSDGTNTVTKVVYDQDKTDGLEMSLTPTTAAFTSTSGNTVLSVSESSPGVFEVMVQDDAATPVSVRAMYATASAGIPFVGIGTNTPAYSLDVNGRLNVSNSIFVQGTALNLNSLEYVNVTGATSGQVLKYNGTNWVASTPSAGGISDVVDDTTPQLGGNLDVNGFSIVTTSAGNIEIAPDSSGYTRIANPSGQATRLKLGGNQNSGGTASIDFKHHTLSANVGARIQTTGTAYGSSTGLKFYVKGRNTSDGAALTDAENLIMTLSHLDGCVIHKQFTAVGGDLTFGHLGNVTTNAKRIGVRTDEPNPTQSTLYIDAGAANYQNRAGGSLFLRAGAGAGSGDSGSILFYTCEGIVAADTTNTNLERARILPNGNFGIGTTTPAQKLDVNGNVSAAAYYVGTSLFALDDLADVDITTTTPTNGDSLVWDNSAGKWVPDGSGGAGGGGSDSFNTIQVTGQSDVVADSGNDTLTLASGSNMSIGTNATTDTITFSVSSTPNFSSITTSGNATIGGNLLGVNIITTGFIASGTTLSSTGNATIGGNIAVTGTSTFGGTATYATGIVAGKIEFIGGGTSVIEPVTYGGNLPADLEIRSNGNVTVVLDYDDNESAQAFEVKSGDGTTIFKVDEDGVTSGLLTTVTPTTTGLSSSYQQGASISATISNFDSATNYVAKIYNSSGVEQTSNPVTVDSSGNISATAPTTIATGYELRVFAAGVGKLRSLENTDAFEVTASRTFTFWRVQGYTSAGVATADRIYMSEIAFYTGSNQTGTAYPTTNMTSNTSESGITLSRGFRYNSSYEAWKATDAYNYTGWWTLGLSNAALNWWQIEFDTAKTFQSIRFNFYSANTQADNVKVFGSNTGAFAGEEIEVADVPNVDGGSSGQNWIIDVNI